MQSGLEISALSQYIVLLSGDGVVSGDGVMCGDGVMSGDRVMRKY